MQANATFPETQSADGSKQSPAENANFSWIFYNFMLFFFTATASQYSKTSKIRLRSNQMSS